MDLQTNIEKEKRDFSRTTRDKLKWQRQQQQQCWGSRVTVRVRLRVGRSVNWTLAKKEARHRPPGSLAFLALQTDGWNRRRRGGGGQLGLGFATALGLQIEETATQLQKWLNSRLPCPPCWSRSSLTLSNKVFVPSVFTQGWILEGKSKSRVGGGGYDQKLVFYSLYKKMINFYLMIEGKFTDFIFIILLLASPYLCNNLYFLVINKSFDLRHKTYYILTFECHLRLLWPKM